VFTNLALHGGAATLLWGDREAAVLSSWQIVRASRHQWQLTATITRTNPFYCRQRPLLFAAPRTRGFWTWAVETLDVGPRTLQATLGQPLQ
jgi:hypothetical protein